MPNPTAAIIIIGNEILSGRTLDINTQYIAQKLSTVGIDLCETRTIPDRHDFIVDTIKPLKEKYTYIFTTGGIGPTHDDITSRAIADLFKVPLELNPDAYKIIHDFYASLKHELNEARIKMAYIPKGGRLIENPISGAPGFVIGNVYVMAGIPGIMQAMLGQILPTLNHGHPIQSKTIDLSIGESIIAKDLAVLQNKYPEIEMGSYPFKINDKHGTSLVLRSVDTTKLEEAYLELLKITEHIRPPVEAD